MSNEKDPLLPVSIVDHQVGSDDNDHHHRHGENDNHHHRRSSSYGGRRVLATLMEGATDALHTVQDGVKDEIAEVQTAFADETMEENNESSYFLEMSLARAWSILPSDVPDVQNAVDKVLGVVDAPTPTDDNGKQGGGANTASKIPLHAYLLLALAVVSLSSIGPMLDLQQECSPIMKIYWRMSGTAMFLFPLCCVDLFQQGGLPRLTLPQFTTFCLAAACYATMSNGFVVAIEYTAVGNAVILANGQAVLFLIGRAEHISLLEGAGASTAFLGAVLCSRDGSSDSSGSISGLFGDALALVAGIGGAGYLIFAKAARQHVTLYTFMFLVMAVGSTFTLLFQTMILKETVTLDCNVHHGVWGWMNLAADRLPLEVSMVLICNIFGSVGYIRAMQHFDPLVVSTAGLMEPVIATLLVFVMGIGGLPGWMGWMGNALVAAGTLAVIYPTNEQAKKVRLGDVLVFWTIGHLQTGRGRSSNPIKTERVFWLRLFWQQERKGRRVMASGRSTQYITTASLTR
eukprot:scaffold4786_cov198-Amphora_coffeaeformis.AAC.8